MDRRKKRATVMQASVSSHDRNQSHDEGISQTSTLSSCSSASASTSESSTQCSNTSTDGDPKMTTTSPTDLVKIPGLDKYSLRPKSIKNRIEVELKRKSPPVKKTPKPKGRPVPLSKYRRRTANARERSRMQEINDAFEELRSAIPDILASSHVSASSGDEGHHRSNSSASSCSRGSPSSQSSKNSLSKITTLRLAVNYISSLAQLLKETEPVEEEERQASLVSPTCSMSSMSSVSISSSKDQQNQRKTMSSETEDMIPSPLGLSSLDLELDDLNGISSEFDSSFLSFYNHNNGDLSSSYHSPANSTETDSGESYSTTTTSVSWDAASLPQTSYHSNQQHSLHENHHHHSEGLEDVCDTFDLILESEGSQVMS